MRWGGGESGQVLYPWEGAVQEERFPHPGKPFASWEASQEEGNLKGSVEIAAASWLQPGQKETRRDKSWPPRCTCQPELRSCWRGWQLEASADMPRRGLGFAAQTQPKGPGVPSRSHTEVCTGWSPGLLCQWQCQQVKGGPGAPPRQPHFLVRRECRSAPTSSHGCPRAEAGLTSDPGPVGARRRQRPDPGLEASELLAGAPEAEAGLAPAAAGFVDTHMQKQGGNVGRLPVLPQWRRVEGWANHGVPCERAQRVTGGVTKGRPRGRLLSGFSPSGSTLVLPALHCSLELDLGASTPTTVTGP